MEKQVKIYEAMANAMAEVGSIGKTKRNQQQGFQFRGIDDVYNQLHAIMAKHRIFTAPEVVADRTEERKTKTGSNLIYRVLTIRYRFYADDGSHIDVTVIGEGMDSGDKASNKAMSIAHKYALFQVFMIPTEDIVDPDSETPPQSKPEPNPELEKTALRFKAALEKLEKVAPDEAVGGYRTRGTELYKSGNVKRLGEIADEVYADLNTNEAQTPDDLL